MGINISLIDGNTLKDDPAWDCARCAGDRDLSVWTCAIEKIQLSDDPYDGVAWRPVSVADFRASLPRDRPNPDRFLKMADMLEANQNLWVYESL